MKARPDQVVYRADIPNVEIEDRPSPLNFVIRGGGFVTGRIDELPQSRRNPILIRSDASTLVHHINDCQPDDVGYHILRDAIYIPRGPSGGCNRQFSHQATAAGDHRVLDRAVVAHVTPDRACIHVDENTLASAESEMVRNVFCLITDEGTVALATGPSGSDCSSLVIGVSAMRARASASHDNGSVTLSLSIMISVAMNAPIRPAI
jgi:hypothetical protein